MPQPRIIMFSSPRTPLGRALAFVGLVAVVVASFFLGILVLAIALGGAVLMMVIRLFRGPGPGPGAGGVNPSGGPNVYEGEAVVVEPLSQELGPGSSEGQEDDDAGR